MKRIATWLAIAGVLGVLVYFSPPVAHARARRAAFRCFATVRTADQWEDCMRGEGYSDPFAVQFYDDKIAQRLMFLRMRR